LVVPPDATQNTGKKTSQIVDFILSGSLKQFTVQGSRLRDLNW